jgi:hypothetical protein
MVDTGESSDLWEVLHERLIFEIGRQALAIVLAKSVF